VETALLALAILALLLLVGAAVSRVVSVVTVRDYQRGVRFSRGRLTGLVSSGSHLIVRPFTEIDVVDARPTTLLVEGQEVMTADGVAIKVTLAARYVVGDPVAATTGDADFRRAIYLMLQLAIRDAVAVRTLDEALAGRREVGQVVHEACASDLATLGIELLTVAVRDLMVPGDLKRAFAGVVGARKEGEAALERVRTETAALRNLANAGRLVEGSPGLLQLRILQQLGASTGNTVMLNVPDGHVAPTEPPAAARVRSAARRPARGPATPEAD
jgi:regulator of protease activity HflC (stomatin/prohibitin superfamily)